MNGGEKRIYDVRLMLDLTGFFSNSTYIIKLTEERNSMRKKHSSFVQGHSVVYIHFLRFFLIYP